MLLSEFKVLWCSVFSLQNINKGKIKTTSPEKWSAVSVALAVPLLAICERVGRVNGAAVNPQKWSHRCWDWITIENNLFSYFVWTPAKGNFGRDSWKLGLYIEITWNLHKSVQQQQKHHQQQQRKGKVYTEIKKRTHTHTKNEIKKNMWRKKSKRKKTSKIRKYSRF